MTRITPSDAASGSDASAAESERIRSVYRYYESDDREQRKRDLSNPGTRASGQIRWETIRRSLIKSRLAAGASILDIGCGTGRDLLRMNSEFSRMRLSLYGIDLLPERIERARRDLPGATLSVGSADHLPYVNETFAVVMASMVFSSILQNDVRVNIANEIKRVVAPYGVILCYEMRYPNPWNEHTRAIGPRTVRNLFRGSTFQFAPVTLLPPLARRLGIFTGIAYGPLHTVPALRGHYLAEIRREGYAKATQSIAAPGIATWQSASSPREAD